MKQVLDLSDVSNILCSFVENKLTFGGKQVTAKKATPVIIDEVLDHFLVEYFVVPEKPSVSLVATVPVIVQPMVDEVPPIAPEGTETV